MKRINVSECCEIIGLITPINYAHKAGDGTKTRKHNLTQIHPALQANLCIGIMGNNKDLVPIFLGNIYNSEFHSGYAGGAWDANYCSPSLTTCQGGGRQPMVIVKENKPKDTIICGGLQKHQIPRLDGISPTLNAAMGMGGGQIPLIWIGDLQELQEYVGIKQATKKGYIECEVGGCADFSFPTSKLRRGRVQGGGGISPTLMAGTPGICRIERNNMETEYKIRRLTPRECFRLQGFTDEEFDKVNNAGISATQEYKMAGNSITVDVLYYIYKELYKVMPYLFNDLKLSSFFSGVGAFESALDRFYNDLNEEENN